MIKEPTRFIRGVSITPGKACTYSIPERWLVNGYPGGTKRLDKPERSAEIKTQDNTRRVVGRYWQAVGWLWLRSKRSTVDLGDGRKFVFRQGLLTLTLPGVSSADHRAIKARILDPFFTYCRNVQGLRDYVWTAEIQPSTGAIHFHAILNQFLDKAKVRQAWNSACERSGLITMSQGALPSTQIEACRSYKGSRSYAAKYLSKGLKSGEIVGRIWSGSHSVTGISKLSTNQLEAAFDAPAALLEVDQISDGWRQFDHNVRMARFDLARVTYRRSPVLYMLFKRHLLKHDQPPEPNALPDNHPPRRAPGSTQIPHTQQGPPDHSPTSRWQMDREVQGSSGRVGHGGFMARDRSTAVPDPGNARAPRPQPSLWDLSQ